MPGLGVPQAVYLKAFLENGIRVTQQNGMAGFRCLGIIPTALRWKRRRVVIDMFDRITFDSKIMGGRACIRGMRIPVSVIVGQIAHGASFEEILEGYPDLEREDIQAALEYAAWLTTEEVYPVEA